MFDVEHLITETQMVTHLPTQSVPSLRMVRACVPPTGAVVTIEMMNGCRPCLRQNGQRPVQMVS
jgi:hypothetical protein